MQFNFDKACNHAEILRDPEFMRAMSKLNMSAAALVYDAPSTKGAQYSNYAVTAGTDKDMATVVNQMDNTDFGLNCIDSFARAQMMRLAMKEINLATAFNSGAVAAKELSDVDFSADTFTQAKVDALVDMGLPHLASVTQYYVR